MQLIATFTLTTYTYKIENNFMIDIVTDHENKNYEAWIYNSNYGIKSLMFGVPEEQQTYEEFLDIVENNLEEYIEDYENENMDWEE